MNTTLRHAPAPPAGTPYAELRASLPVRLAFVLFTLSFVGFMAQGAAGFLTGPLENRIPVPVHLLLVYAAALLVMLDARARRVLLMGRYGRVPVVGAVVVMLTLGLREGIFAMTELESKRLFQIFSGCVIYLFAFVLVRNAKYTRRLLSTLFVMTCLSAVLSMVEVVLNVRMPWSLYAKTRGASFGGGLETFPVSFAYAVLAPCVIAGISVLCRPRGGWMPGRFLSSVTLALGTTGLIVSASRSGLMGLAVGCFAGLLLHGRHRLRTLQMVGVPATSVLVVLGPMLAARVLKEPVLEDVRLYGTWVTYLPLVIMHPLGVSLEESVTDKVFDAQAELGLRVDQTVVSEALAIAPHNAFLTAGVEFGWAAVFVLALIYFSCWRHGRRALRLAPDPGPRVLVAALLACIPALLVHMSFHNASLLQGEMRNWLYLGMLTGFAVHLRVQRRRARAAAEAQYRYRPAEDWVPVLGVPAPAGPDPRG